MKNVVENKVLRSRASSESLLSKGVNSSRDKTKNSIPEESEALARETSKLSQKSVHSNAEDPLTNFNRDRTRLSQRSTHSLSELGSSAPANPSNKVPQTYGDEFTDLASIEDNQSKNSSVDSGTGSFSQHDTQSGCGSQRQLPNNHLVQNSNNKQSRQKHRKFNAKSPPPSGHIKAEERKSAGSTSVNAIELTPVDESKA